MWWGVVDVLSLNISFTYGCQFSIVLIIMYFDKFLFASNSIILRTIVWTNEEKWSKPRNLIADRNVVILLHTSLSDRLSILTFLLINTLLLATKRWEYCISILPRTFKQKIVAAYIYRCNLLDNLQSRSGKEGARYCNETKNFSWFLQDMWFVSWIVVNELKWGITFLLFF